MSAAPSKPSASCVTIRADGQRPTVAAHARRHLGQLLSMAYAEADEEASARARFGELLACLDAALTGARDRGDAVFRADLLAVLPALRRFALSLIHAPDQADDLVQDTMLRAWRGRAGFIPGTNLEAWTFTILRHQFYSDRRKCREVSDADGSHAERLTVAPTQGDYLDLCDVRSALASLAPTMREALVLVTVGGVTYEEAAHVLGCRIGTVKSRVGRARIRLVEILGHRIGDIGTDDVVRSVTGGAP